MRSIVVLLLTWLLSLSAFAKGAPKAACLDLTRTQADTAVALIKRASSKGAPLIYQSKRESGLVRPLTVWAEKGKRKNTYRVRVDNRPIDISLAYIARSSDDKKSWNVAWLSGCRPGVNRPISISNF